MKKYENSSVLCTVIAINYFYYLEWCTAPVLTAICSDVIFIHVITDCLSVKR